jgi:hypothetical protein
MYESARNISFYFYFKPYTRIKTSFDFGFEIGNLIRLLLYPKHKQLDFDLAQGNIWEWNYPWDNKI